LQRAKVCFPGAGLALIPAAVLLPSSPLLFSPILPSLLPPLPSSSPFPPCSSSLPPPSSALPPPSPSEAVGRRAVPGERRGGGLWAPAREPAGGAFDAVGRRAVRSMRRAGGGVFEAAGVPGGSGGGSHGRQTGKRGARMGSFPVTIPPRCKIPHLSMRLLSRLLFCVPQGVGKPARSHISRLQIQFVYRSAAGGVFEAAGRRAVRSKRRVGGWCVRSGGPAGGVFEAAGRRASQGAPAEGRTVDNLVSVVRRSATIRPPSGRLRLRAPLVILRSLRAALAAMLSPGMLS